MLHLSDAWRDHNTFWITYASPRTVDLDRAYLLRNIGVNPLRVAVATLKSVWILLKERPDRGFDRIGDRDPGVLFWEAIPYADGFHRGMDPRPTGTGRLVYPVSDRYLVQWPELLEHHRPKVEFGGSLL